MRAISFMLCFLWLLLTTVCFQFLRIQVSISLSTKRIFLPHFPWWSHFRSLLRNINPISQTHQKLKCCCIVLRKHYQTLFEATAFFGVSPTISTTSYWLKLSGPLTFSISKTDEYPAFLAVCTGWPVGLWPLFFPEKKKLSCSITKILTTTNKLNR